MPFLIASGVLVVIGSRAPGSRSKEGHSSERSRSLPPNRRPILIGSEDLSLSLGET